MAGETFTTAAQVDAYVHSRSIRVRSLIQWHDQTRRPRDEADVAQLQQWEELRARLHTEVAAYQAAVEHLRHKTGMADAWAAHNLTRARWYELADSAAQSVPTTIGGAAALARFAAEQSEMENEERATAAMKSVAAFLSRAA